MKLHPVLISQVSCEDHANNKTVITTTVVDNLGKMWVNIPGQQPLWQEVSLEV